MHKYYYDDRKIITSKEQLINFLNHKVLVPILKDERKTAIVKEAQRRSSLTQKLLDNMNTPEEVSNFFWDNIINNPQGYESHKILKECGFVTFEDVRNEFNFLCYGE